MGGALEGKTLTYFHGMYQVLPDGEGEVMPRGLGTLCETCGKRVGDHIGLKQYKGAALFCPGTEVAKEAAEFNKKQAPFLPQPYGDWPEEYQ